MGKMWATEEAMNAMEANELTNRRLEGGVYVFTDKRAAYEYIQENEKPIPKQKRNVKRMQEEIDPGYVKVAMKWEPTVADPASKGEQRRREGERHSADSANLAFAVARSPQSPPVAVGVVPAGHWYALLLLYGRLGDGLAPSDPRL